MKKMNFVTIAVMMMCVLSGCANYANKYDKSTIIIKKNNSIVEVAVENFKDSSVKEEELASYVEEQIQSYNDENGKGKIKKKSIHTEDMSKVKLVLTYKNIESFNGFNLQECRLDDLSNIKESELKGSYTSAEGKKVEYKDLRDIDKAKVFIVSEAADIVVSGDVLYYSEEASFKDGIVTTTGKDNAIIIFK